jgi:hypothetical protein
VVQALDVSSMFLQELRVIEILSVFEKDIETNYHLRDQVNCDQNATN